MSKTAEGLRDPLLNFTISNLWGSRLSSWYRHASWFTAFLNLLHVSAHRHLFQSAPHQYVSINSYIITAIICLLRFVALWRHKRMRTLNTNGKTVPLENHPWRDKGWIGYYINGMVRCVAVRDWGISTLTANGKTVPFYSHPLRDKEYFNQ